MANPEQKAILWPQLREEKRFYYNGMPTGIATLPATYEKWESTYNDVMDLAAMGRVWYNESLARVNMRDANGLIETIRRVCREGRENGYYWRERYNEKGGYGAEKYCEYPANLIRIIQHSLLGVEHGLDGTLFIGPTVPEDFWKAGFGQVLSWNGRKINYKMWGDKIAGEYSGKNSLPLSVRLHESLKKKIVFVSVNGKSAKFKLDNGWITVVLPFSPAMKTCNFEIVKQ